MTEPEFDKKLGETVRQAINGGIHPTLVIGLLAQHSFDVQCMVKFPRKPKIETLPPGLASKILNSKN